MATKKRVTQYQYEPPITPRHWSGDELNYAVRLSQTLDDIYNKYSSLKASVNKEAPVTSVNGMTGDVVLEFENCAEQYPVGAIYISAASTSPASLFGGTWEQITDRFLLAASDTYAAGSTGGAATHKLTVSETPSHYHSVAGNSKDSSAPGFNGYLNVAHVNQYTNAWFAITNTVGGDMPHNNMPPYLAVYVWQRIA